MAFDFEKYMAKGNVFVKIVMEELKLPRDKAGGIIRAVLHALRNRVSHEESFHLIAQLPMALKGIYVDGWKFIPDFKPIVDIDDFLGEVHKEDGGFSGYDFGDNAKARVAVAAVFKAMNYFVSEGEMKDITGVLPNELKRFIRKSIAGSEIVL